MSFDRAMFQENIAAGQHNEKALLEYWNKNGWEKISEFTTIGYKRLLRFDIIKTNKVRITIIKSKGNVQLAEVGFYKASPMEE